MPPLKTLDDQITFPLQSAQKRALKAVAAHYGRKPADMMRVILGDYLAQPEIKVIVQASQAEAHAQAVTPVTEG